MSIPVPIQQFVLHPTFGAMRRELIPGVFSGIGDLTRPGPTVPFNHVNAFGLVWSFITIPETIGFELGTPVIFEDRMVQLSAMHEDNIGNEFVSEFHDFRAEGIWWMWSNAGPSRIHYEIRIGVELAFYWLVAQLF